MASVPAIESILAEEREMADWLIRHIPQTTEQFLLRSDASVSKQKNNLRREDMFRHVKQLQYTFGLPNRIPALPIYYWNNSAVLRRAGRRLPLLYSGLSDDDPGRKDMLMDIATEELSHLEIIGTLVGMLNKGAKGALAEGVENEAELYRSMTENGNDSHITSLLYGGGTPLTNSAGCRGRRLMSTPLASRPPICAQMWLPRPERRSSMNG